MGKTAQAVLQDALQLVDDERLELASQLIESVRASRLKLDALWLTEVRRRDEELDSGDTSGVSWEDARKQILRS